MERVEGRGKSGRLPVDEAREGVIGFELWHVSREQPACREMALGRRNLGSSTWTLRLHSERLWPLTCL